VIPLEVPQVDSEVVAARKHARVVAHDHVHTTGMLCNTSELQCVQTWRTKNEWQV
jgi:hypothetical protein